MTRETDLLDHALAGVDALEQSYQRAVRGALIGGMVGGFLLGLLVGIAL